MGGSTLLPHFPDNSKLLSPTNAGVWRRREGHNAASVDCFARAEGRRLPLPIPLYFSPFSEVPCVQVDGGGVKVTFLGPVPFHHPVTSDVVSLAFPYKIRFWCSWTQTKWNICNARKAPSRGHTVVLQGLDVSNFWLSGNLAHIYHLLRKDPSDPGTTSLAY